MTRLVFIFIFSFGTLLSKEEIVFGTLTGSGAYIQTTQGQTYPFRYSELSRELTDLTGKKVRMLCNFEPDEEGCLPIRYEIAPFAGETNLPSWTIKVIPKYVYRSLTAFNPTVTPDGNMLFWTILTEVNGHSTQKIWYSELDKNGFWKKGVQMEAPLNNNAPSAVISPLPGGNELFVFGSFSDQETYHELKRRYEIEKMELVRTVRNPKELEIRYNALKDKYKKDMEKIQNRVPLYKSTKLGTGWSPPMPINFPEFYNLHRSEENPQMQVFGGSTLSSSGRILIYSAKHKDSFGKLDLYVTQMDEEGAYPLGVNLGRVINTEHEEMAPFLASDDRTMFFSSNGHNGLTVYYTQRVGESWTDWTKPQEISKNLTGVNYFSIPASGNWAYASRQGHLIMASLPNEAKPNPVIVVKGKVTDDKGQPLAAEIFYESLSTKEKKGGTISDPNTGAYTIVLPYGDIFGFYADKEGYLPVNKNRDLRTGDNVYKEYEVDLVLPKIEKGKEIVLNNLFFDSNKWEIKKESEPELDRLGELMKKNKKVEVLIEGHTDSVGKNEDNLTLSLNRANSVAEYLIKKHSIEASRLKAVGLGEEVPLASNDSNENRAKNRRVVFKIIKQ